MYMAPMRHSVKQVVGVRSLHWFPTEPGHREAWVRWIRNCRRNDFSVSSTSVLCSEHFDVRHTHFGESLRSGKKVKS